MWNLGKRKSFLLARRRRADRVSRGHPAICSSGTSNRRFHLSSDFVVHPIRWDRCPLVAADPHARAWLTLQSHRGLAHNTLDAYSRGLDRYFRFLAATPSLLRIDHARGDWALSGQFAGRWRRALERYDATAFNSGAPVPCISDGRRSARQQPGSTSHAGRPLIARHHKLPWIPNDEDWHSILAAARQEPIRNRVDAGLCL